MPSDFRLPNISARELAERNLDGEGRVTTTELVLRLAAAAAAAELGVPGVGRPERSFVLCEDA